MLRIGCGGSLFAFVLFCFALLCVLSSFEEESTGCFAFIVLPMSRYCKCSVTIPHCAMCWSAVCECGIS